jgi:hypothetical protein
MCCAKAARTIIFSGDLYCNIYPGGKNAAVKIGINFQDIKEMNNTCLDRLFRAWSRPHENPSIVDDRSLHKLIVSGYSINPVSILELEELEKDGDRIHVLRSAFAEFLAHMQIRHGLCLIEQKALEQAGQDRFLQVTLTPRELVEHRACDARWISEMSQQDAYVTSLDVMLIASDEFHCLALACSETSAKVVRLVAEDVGLFVFEHINPNKTKNNTWAK